MNINTIIGYLITYRYVLIVPLTIIEGPIVMVICGFLLRTGIGQFDTIPLYFSLIISDLIGDIGWYCVGRFWGLPFVRKYGHFYSISEKTVEKTTTLFHRYHNRILFISKITMGFGFALVTLITAGIAKVPFKKYIVFNVSGQFIWTGVLLLIGYFFGNLYYTVDKSFRIATVIALIVIIIVVIYGFGKYVSKIIGERLSRES